MVDLDDLLFSGSIIISMDKDGQLVGTALFKISNGVVPIELSSENLEFINSYKLVINKLKNGNKIYCNGGYMYIGYNELRGPYAEEEVFISFIDVESLSFVEMLNNIEYKLSKNNVNRLELVKQGDYFRRSYKK